MQSHFSGSVSGAAPPAALRSKDAAARRSRNQPPAAPPLARGRPTRHGGPRWNPRVEELVRAEPEHVEKLGVDVPEITVGDAGDGRVEGAAASQRSMDELVEEVPFASVESFDRPVGEPFGEGGSAADDVMDDAQGGATGGRKLRSPAQLVADVKTCARHECRGRHHAAAFGLHLEEDAWPCHRRTRRQRHHCQWPSAAPECPGTGPRIPHARDGGARPCRRQR